MKHQNPASCQATAGRSLASESTQPWQHLLHPFRTHRSPQLLSPHRTRRQDIKDGTTGVIYGLPPFRQLWLYSHHLHSQVFSRLHPVPKEVCFHLETRRRLTTSHGRLRRKNLRWISASKPFSTGKVIATGIVCIETPEPTPTAIHLARRQPNLCKYSKDW